MGITKMNQEEKSMFGFDVVIKKKDGQVVKPFIIPHCFCYALPSQYTRPNSKNLILEFGDFNSITYHPELHDPT
jgi:hypothetical protein